MNELMKQVEEESKGKERRSAQALQCQNATITLINKLLRTS